MSARLLDGKEVARRMHAEFVPRLQAVAGRRGAPPGLAVVLLGDDPASRSYVTGKRQDCAKIGIRAFDHDLPADTPQDALLQLIAKLNADPEVDGVLVQLPLPRGIDEARVLLAIDPDKDVDGFHPVNVGRLMLDQPGFRPCTPNGIVQLLLRHQIATAGAHVVVVGRSHIVGKPLANLLLNKGSGGDATVTVCHSRTADLVAMTRQADILVAAMGRPRAITAPMVKPGAVVIDVGMNRIGQTAPGRAKLCGDVDFEPVSQVASAITPVPGGVGPMTRAMLLHNTILSAERRLGLA